MTSSAVLALATLCCVAGPPLVQVRIDSSSGNARPNNRSIQSCHPGNKPVQCKITVFVTTPLPAGGIRAPDQIAIEKRLVDSLRSGFSLSGTKTFAHGDVFAVADTREKADVVLTLIAHGVGRESLRKAGSVASIPPDNAWLVTTFDTIDHRTFFTASWPAETWAALANVTVEGLLNYVVTNYDSLLATRDMACGTIAGAVRGRCADPLAAAHGMLSVNVGSPDSQPDLQNEVQQEIARIRDGRHAAAPSDRGSAANLGGQTALVVENETPYTLSVFLSGPVSRKVEIPSHASATVRLSAGEYEVAARASGADVIPFYSVQTFTAGVRYSERFY